MGAIWALWPAALALFQLLPLGRKQYGCAVRVGFAAALSASGVASRLGESESALAHFRLARPGGVEDHEAAAGLSAWLIVAATLFGRAAVPSRHLHCRQRGAWNPSTERFVRTIGINRNKTPAKVGGTRGPGLRGVAMHLGDIFLNGGAAFDRLFDRYGDVLWLTVPKFIEILPGVSQVALVRDPAVIKPLFASPDQAVDSTKANRLLEMLYGDQSLFLIDGPEHLRLRRLLLPRLRGEALQKWADIIVCSTRRESCTWLTMESRWAHPRLLDVSLEVILKITLGISNDALPTWKESWRELHRTWGSDEMVIRYSMRRLGGLRRWGRLQRALARCNELVFAEIGRRRATPDRQRADLLDLMMRADGDPLTDNALRDQIFTILIAGHETPATTASWAIERLLRRRGAMEKATAEARSAELNRLYAGRRL